MGFFIGSEKRKNKRALLGFLYVLLFLCLFVVSFAAPAQHALTQVQNAGTTSAAVANEINTQSAVIVPKLIDQISKNADSKTKKIIQKNRTQITSALDGLLKSPELKATLIATFNPLGAALVEGKSSVELNTVPLANLLAKEVNSLSGKTIITTKDLNSMSKTQVVDISSASKGINKAHSILSKVIFLWILIGLLLVSVIWLRRQYSFKVLWKIFLSLGLPILALWIVVPKIAINQINKRASSDLASSLFPILYRELSGFTRNLAISYLLLSLLFLILTRVKVVGKVVAAS